MACLLLCAQTFAITVQNQIKLQRKRARQTKPNDHSHAVFPPSLSSGTLSWFCRVFLARDRAVEPASTSATRFNLSNPICPLSLSLALANDILKFSGIFPPPPLSEKVSFPMRAAAMSKEDDSPHFWVKSGEGYFLAINLHCIELACGWCCSWMQSVAFLRLSLELFSKVRNHLRRRNLSSDDCARKIYKQ